MRPINPLAVRSRVGIPWIIKYPNLCGGFGSLDRWIRMDGCGVIVGTVVGTGVTVGLKVAFARQPAMGRQTRNQIAARKNRFTLIFPLIA